MDDLVCKLRHGWNKNSSLFTSVWIIESDSILFTVLHNWYSPDLPWNFHKINYKQFIRPIKVASTFASTCVQNFVELQYCANVIRQISRIFNDNKQNYVWSDFSTIFLQSYCFSDNDISLHTVIVRVKLCGTLRKFEGNFIALCDSSSESERVYQTSSSPAIYKLWLFLRCECNSVKTIHLDFTWSSFYRCSSAGSYFRDARGRTNAEHRCLRCFLQEILDKQKLKYSHSKTVDLTVLMWTLACQFNYRFVAENRMENRSELQIWTWRGSTLDVQFGKWIT